MVQKRLEFEAKFGVKIQTFRFLSTLPTFFFNERLTKFWQKTGKMTKKFKTLHSVGPSGLSRSALEN